MVQHRAILSFADWRRSLISKISKMKRIIEQVEKDALATLNSDKAQALLKYILSPVEKAALRRSFRPFQFNLNGKKIYISDLNNRRLLFIITDKLNLLTFIVKEEQKSTGIPLFLREVLEDPAEILGLPPKLVTTCAPLSAILCIVLFNLVAIFS